MILLKKLNNKRQVTMSIRQIEKMKNDATKHAVRVTQLFPLWVLRTKYGFGEKRLKEFAAHYSDLMESYNKGYLDLEDISEALKEESGVNFYEESKL